MMLYSLSGGLILGDVFYMDFGHSLVSSLVEKQLQFTRKVFLFEEKKGQIFICGYRVFD